MRARTVAAVAASAVLPVALLLGSAPAVAGSGNPGGNNGTIKVAEVDQVGTESNDPHVACTFALEWYNFDSGAVSTVAFESVSPTKAAVVTVATGPTTVQLESDAAKGGTDLDGREIYTLSFVGEPHQNQGFHVNVTASTTGSQGNDTKSKTFWVGPCETATEPGPTDPGPTDPGPTDPGPTDPGPTDPGPTDPGPTDPGPTEPFDWNWEYDAPTCAGLTVTYPADIPSGQANDVNVRIETPGGQQTLNFHNNAGTWSGTTPFAFADHAGWPAGLSTYAVTWVQVGGTNYHWQGDVSCATDGDPTTPDVPQAVTEVSGFRSGTLTVRRGSTVAADTVVIEQSGPESLTLEQYSAGTWTVAQTVSTTDRGIARVTYPRLAKKGTYKFRLTVSQTIGTTGDTTAVLTVRVG